MRLLHTADWHLGRPFHGASLLDHQAAFLDWLLERAREERIDAVVVAGDLYDRALPPAEAVALAGDALGRLAGDGRQVVVISGNHDSAQRLGFAAPLLSRAGLHFRTRATDCGRPVSLPGVALYGIPYLEPELVAAELGVERRSHEAVLRAAMDRVRADLKRHPGGTRSVVVAHAFVAGGSPAASERELSVGGAGYVTPGLFHGADYVALGHLHRPQAVRGGRYAGSPLALSFSEAADVKSVTVVDFAPEEPAITVLPCPVPRALARLNGTLEELLSDPVLAAHEHDWVEATLTDAARPNDAMARLQRRFPHAVCLAFAPQGAYTAAETSYAERLRGLSEDEVLARFVLDVRGTPVADEELALLRQAMDAGRMRQAQA
jgi:exonuclease SbcD